MCCLGQFANQLGISGLALREAGPEELAQAGAGLYDANFVYSDGEVIQNTRLSDDLMKINDSEHTDVWEKLCGIAKRLDEQKCALLVTGDLPI